MAKRPRKVTYPPADPGHLCRCSCHTPDSAMVHFDACCHSCECGANVEFAFREEHLKTCVPRRARRRDETQEP